MQPVIEPKNARTLEISGQPSPPPPATPVSTARPAATNGTSAGSRRHLALATPRLSPTDVAGNSTITYSRLFLKGPEGASVALDANDTTLLVMDLSRTGIKFMLLGGPALGSILVLDNMAIWHQLLAWDEYWPLINNYFSMNPHSAVCFINSCELHLFVLPCICPGPCGAVVRERSAARRACCLTHFCGCKCVTRSDCLPKAPRYIPRCLARSCISRTTVTSIIHSCSCNQV
jgi:hypothetical protein